MSPISLLQDYIDLINNNHSTNTSSKKNKIHTVLLKYIKSTKTMSMCEKYALARKLIE